MTDGEIPRYIEQALCRGARKVFEPQMISCQVFNCYYPSGNCLHLIHFFHRFIR